jgi:hypothetical protein
MGTHPSSRLSVNDIPSTRRPSRSIHVFIIISLMCFLSVRLILRGRHSARTAHALTHKLFTVKIDQTSRSSSCNVYTVPPIHSFVVTIINRLSDSVRVSACDPLCLLAATTPEIIRFDEHQTLCSSPQSPHEGYIRLHFSSHRRSKLDEYPADRRRRHGWEIYPAIFLLQDADHPESTRIALAAAPYKLFFVHSYSDLLNMKSTQTHLAAVAALTSGVFAINCDKASLQSALPSIATVEFAQWMPGNSTFTVPKTDIAYPVLPTQLRAACAVQVSVKNGTSIYGFGVFLPDDWSGRFL